MSLMRKTLAGGALATLMIAAGIAGAAPAQATVTVSCSTDIEAGTRGSTVLAKCSGTDVVAYRVAASCLRPDGSGLRFTARGEYVLVMEGYWSTYYPCKSPRSVRGEWIELD
jgi:hypothetical protein